jgi:hypothetical protein
LGAAVRIFEDQRGRRDAQERRRQLELRRLKSVNAEITAENLNLKRGLSG